MGRSAFLALVAGLTTGLAHAPLARAGGEDVVAVMVGDGPQFDACGAIGVVSGLDPEGGNALVVRAGPGVGYRRLDSVTTGQPLRLCRRQGRWHAVVYSKTGAACGLDRPIDPARPYAGPCAHGWVYGAYVTPTAG